MNRHTKADQGESSGSAQGGNHPRESLARFAEIAAAVQRQNQQQEQSSTFVDSDERVRSPNQAIDKATAGEILDTGSALPISRAKRRKTTHSSGDDDSSKGSASTKNAVRFREYQAEIWSEKFEDLCKFRKQFGHCHVPHTYAQNAPLAQWVKRQRYQYKLRSDGKRSTLSDERIRLLNKIGFIWNSHDAVWEERWNELNMYKQMHGHCIVPSNYEPNPQLAIWVKRQRRQHKFFSENQPTSMTQERVVKLEGLGFAWDCRKPASRLQQQRSRPPGWHSRDGSTASGSSTPNKRGSASSSPVAFMPPTVSVARLPTAKAGDSSPIQSSPSPPPPPTKHNAKSTGEEQEDADEAAPSASASTNEPKYDFLTFSKFQAFPQFQNQKKKKR